VKSTGSHRWKRSYFLAAARFLDPAAFFAEDFLARPVFFSAPLVSSEIPAAALMRTGTWSAPKASSEAVFPSPSIS
jgi:hypothetical protein